MNTPKGQVPEALRPIQRYKIGYHSDDWGQRSSTPSGIPDASGSWVRYADHVAALAAGQAVTPAEPTPELQRMTAGRASFFMERFLREEKLLGPNEQAAVQFVIAMLATRPAPPAMDGGEDARPFPAMTPELAKILGTMCFQCVTFAQALRAAGHQIETRAEAEQAAVLHWMLGHYFRSGEDGWRDAASDDMKRMGAEAAARAAQKEGAKP